MLKFLGTANSSRDELFSEMLQRLIHIEDKMNAILPKVNNHESSGHLYQGHPDQPFGCTTYSQFGEDLIVINAFHILNVSTPSYMDIGAHHPFIISNTALLHSRGSRGINIEANPNLFAAFAKHRPGDINLCLGVAPAEGALDFYFIDDWSGRNTFIKEVAELFVRQNPQFRIQKTQTIPVKTLNWIVAEYSNNKFPDFLSVDVEGLDIDIIKNTNFGDIGPLIICVECELNYEKDRVSRLIDLMREKGYAPYTRTLGNLIFARSSEIEKLGMVLSL